MLVFSLSLQLRTCDCERDRGPRFNTGVDRFTVQNPFADKFSTGDYLKMSWRTMPQASGFGKAPKMK